MQLVLATGALPPDHPFLKEYTTYKYRDEVKLLNGLPGKELAAITAAAYAFLYPCIDEGTAVMPLRAIRCAVPVITTHAAAIFEVAGDAVMYADPFNFEDIADKMMLLFKDEVKRAEVIKKASELMQRTAAPQTIQALRDLLPVKSS